MKLFYGYIFSYLYIFLLLLISEILRRKLKLDVEITRKFIHIFVSFVFLIMFHYFRFSMHMFIPIITFIILNYVSIKKNIFQSLNRKKSDSYGIVFYPLSLLILWILVMINNDFLIPFFVGLFCMAFGDGLSPFSSKLIKSKTFRNGKTLIGSLTVFLISLSVVLIVNKIYQLDISFVKISLTALSSAIIELLSKRGFDNLILPIGVALISFLLIYL